MKRGDRVSIPVEGVDDGMLAVFHHAEGHKALVRLEPFKLRTLEGKSETVSPPNPWRVVRVDDLTPA